jgi:hypothetical protein
VGLAGYVECIQNFTLKIRKDITWETETQMLSFVNSSSIVIVKEVQGDYK